MMFIVEDIILVKKMMRDIDKVPLSPLIEELD
jgi:hypothetical protein